MSTFDALAQQWDERYAANGWSTIPDPHLSDLVEGLTPGTALDLGCGTGRNSLFLARLGWAVTGVDGSQVGLDAASEQMVREHLSWTPVRADLTTYEADGEFDLVVIANIHLAASERAGFFARAARALVPGGHLYIVGHHLDSLGHQGPPDPTRLFTLDTFSSGVEGVDTIRLERVSSPADRDGQPNVEVVLWAQRPRQ